MSVHSRHSSLRHEVLWVIGSGTITIMRGVLSHSWCVLLLLHGIIWSGWHIGIGAKSHRTTLSWVHPLLLRWTSHTHRWTSHSTARQAKTINTAVIWLWFINFSLLLPLSWLGWFLFRWVFLFASSLRSWFWAVCTG